MERIKVGVKIRPLIRREKSASCDVHWLAVSENSISQVDPVTQQPKGDPHVFDNVFGPDSSNREVFEVLVKPIVESAVKGFNGTIFAYGQTASGKTYTMMGDQYEPGIIPQAVDMVFQTIEATNGREFLLRVCYMEIYNEKVHDLLNKQNRNLKISEDSLGNVIVKDLEESITSSSQMVMDLMRKGENIRKIGVTNMNERSSRSHSIFRIIIESRQAGGSDVDEAIQVSHLNLVDLAGSERAGATGAVGDQFKEGCAINKSLFTLGKVISQLSDGETSFVNFRDSKLTRILQSSLGGNALTAIICAITPAAIDETSSTLGFASRARNIKTKAQVNEVVSDRAMLKRYVKQIDRLNSALSTLEQQKNAENMHLVKENNLLQERLNRLKDALLGSHSHLNVDTAREMKLKKLRRRTWSAPHRHTARLSLAFPPLQKTNSIAELPVDRDTSDLSLMNSDNEEDAFCTPLEEFEKALIKAERAKSMDVGEWLPPVEDVDEDIFSKSPEKDFEDPPLSYVQTRRNRGHLNRLNEVDNVVYETPPSKLRSKIVEVERELHELNEFTRLEKQLYNEDMSAELERVKTELKEVSAECETLKEVKKQLECMKQTDRTAHDYQMMLMDSTKTISTLRDENNIIKQKLTELTVQCDDMVKLRNKLTDTEHHLSKVLKENSELSSKLKKQDEKVFHLNNEKEDFDIQLQIMISKYEVRMKDMAQALEEARQQSSGVHQTALQKNYNGLYALQEEPSMEELLQQVQFLEEQCKALKSGKDLLVKELASKQANICTLEEQITSLSVSAENSQTLQEELNTIRSELENLRLRETSLVQQLKERDSELATLRKAMDSMKEKLIKFSSCEKTLNADDNNGTEPNSVQYELSGLQSAYEILTQELKEKEEKIVNAAVEMEQLREKILLLEQDIGNSNDQNQVSQEVTLNSSLLKLEEQEALINQVTSCENKIAAQQEKISSLEEHVKILSASADKCQSLEEELCAARTELENLKSRETSLVLQLTEMDQEVTDLKSSSSKLPALMSLNDTLTQELREKGEEILNAAVEMEQLREKIASLEADACRSSDKMLPAQDDSSSASVQMVGEHEKLVDKITACEKIIATQQENISCLEEEKTKLTAIVDSCQNLQQELNDAKIKLEDLKTHHSSLMQELDEKNQTVTELDSVRAEMSSLKLTHTKELQERDQQIAKAGTEMESLREKVLLLEQNVGSSNDQREVLQDSTLDTSRLTFEEQEALINEVTCCKNEIAAQHEKIRSLEAEVTRLTLIAEQYQSLQEENIASRSEIEAIKARENRLVEQLNEKNCELSERAVTVDKLRDLQNDLVTLKDDNASLLVEVKTKNSVLKDSESELSLLRAKFEALQSSSCNIHEIENLSKDIMQQKTEVKALQQKNAILQEEIKYKNTLHMEVEDEVRQLKAKLQELAGSLMKDELCQKCCDLEKVMKNQHSEKKMIEEEMCSLQRQRNDLELEIKSVQKTLVAEVKAISDSSDDLLNASLSDLLSTFLASIMKVQEHVASVFQSKLNTCNSELDAYAQRELELQEKIKLLESDVAQLTDVNCTLNSQLMEAKQQEVLKENLEISFQNLKSLLNCAQDLSQDGVLSVLKSKLIELSSISDNIKDLKTTVDQMKTENNSLSMKIAERDGEIITLNNKLSNMECDAVQSSDYMKRIKEKAEKLELDLSVQKKLVRDLQAEALHTAECLEELDKIKERVKILTDELLTERALKSTLQNEVSAKTQTILDLKESLNELQAKVQTQSKQLSGKESLQCKASSLYNDLTEKKEIILKLEEEIRQNKSSLEEKQAEIGSLFKHIEELKKNLVVVETNLSKVKAERDLAEKNLSLKPSDEVSELKAEIECLRHYHEDAVKSLRETRHKNRKITAELVKTKEKLDAAENSTPGATSEVAHLKELLLEEISKRRQLETQVEEQLKELSQLSRSKPSRSSDFKQKREASDARQVKAELESLKEKYDKLQEQASKSSEVSNLMKVLKEKEELVQEKDQKIADLTKDKDDLDKECEEVLSWGRSIDKEKSELAERFTEVLKDLARTKSTLFSVAMAKVEILKTSCKGDMGAIDKTSKDVLEMQISSKEKSAKNAQSRAETLIKSIKDIEGRKILDHDLLEKLCSDLDKENQFLLDIDSEFATICEKVEREKRQVSECDGCKELLGWGKHQEALAIERDNLVDKLNGELKKLKCKGASKEQVLPQKSLEEISSRGDCKCEELQGLVQTQRTELADKKAEITELKMKQLILNKPAEEKLKRLEEKLKISKEEITNLKLQNRRILKTYQENTECTSSQTVMKKCAYTQTTDSNEQIYKSQYWSGGPSGIVDEANRIALEDKVRKLEREKETYKKLCVERKHRNDLLEDKLKKYLKENQENEPATPYSLRSRKN